MPQWGLLGVLRFPPALPSWAPARAGRPLECRGVGIDAGWRSEVIGAVAGDIRVGVVGDAMRAHALCVVEQAEPRALRYPPVRAAAGLELAAARLCG